MCFLTEHCCVKNLFFIQLLILIEICMTEHVTSFQVRQALVGMLQALSEMEEAIFMFSWYRQ